MAAPVTKTFTILHKTYPRVRHYLNYDTPLQLLVASILSPQVRDEKVNEATPRLFARYKTAEQFANAKLSALKKEIRSITFYETKARNIKAACKQLCEKFNNAVPKTVKELTSLPGIGEKTAHSILQNAYDIVEGIVVDTHVLRVAYRLGWTTGNKNAKKVDRELREIVPKKEWKKLPLLFKAHGRAVCKAPTPICSECPLTRICPKKGVDTQR